MKHKALRGLRVVLGLIVFAAGMVFAAGGQSDGLRVLVQQIETIGARQWLGLVAGSIVPGALVTGPLIGRIAPPRRAVPAAKSGTGNTG